MRRFTLVSTMALVVCLAGLCLGAEEKKAAKASTTPTALPPNIAKELGFFVGDWAMDGTVAGKALTGRWSGKWAPEKQCILIRSELTLDGQQACSNGVSSWDAGKGEIVTVQFFSNGVMEEIRYKLASPGVLKGTYSVSAGGEPIKADCEVRTKRPNEWTFSSAVNIFDRSKEGKFTLRCVRLTAKPTKGAATEPKDIPKEAMDAMKYRVGAWQAVVFLDGVKQPKPASEITKWAPGDYCIQHTVSLVSEGADINASGTTGWNANTKQLVEHWYASDGSYATFRYFLGKKKDAWVGTCSWVYSDGRKRDGDSVIVKNSQNEWEWTATYSEQGKTHTTRTINRRVK